MYFQIRQIDQTHLVTCSNFLNLADNKKTLTPLVSQKPNFLTVTGKGTLHISLHTYHITALAKTVFYGD